MIVTSSSFPGNSAFPGVFLIRETDQKGVQSKRGGLAVTAEWAPRVVVRKAGSAPSCLE